MIRWALLLCALCAACGPRRGPPRPGEVLFWKVTSSTVGLIGCTDDPQFRDPLKPITLDESTYLIVRIESNGAKATTLDCSTTEASSCVESASGIVFDVAGSELLFSRSYNKDITGTTCKLHAEQAWVGQDKGTSLSLSVSNTLSLTDDPGECPQFELEVKRQSPNGLGLEGCQVRFNVEAVLEE
ncbi:MAG: hypothetical protein ACT4TC_03450 [Myxococcaceae bacterium]